MVIKRLQKGLREREEEKRYLGYIPPPMMFDLVRSVLHQGTTNFNSTVSVSIKSLHNSQAVLAVGIFFVFTLAENR
jgi:hypothetical protein